jgi:hypothetical protein
MKQHSERQAKSRPLLFTTVDKTLEGQKKKGSLTENSHIKQIYKNCQVIAILRV